MEHLQGKRFLPNSDIYQITQGARIRNRLRHCQFGAVCDPGSAVGRDFCVLPTSTLVLGAVKGVPSLRGDILQETARKRGGENVSGPGLGLLFPV